MTNTQQTAWQHIYDKYFAELGVTVPAFEVQKSKIAIYVDERLTCDMINAILGLPVWKMHEDSIDAFLDKSWEKRCEIGSYILQVEDGIGPDVKYLGNSVEDIFESGVLGITLKERMLFEMFIFETECQILDIFGVTICSGSRYIDGGVPSVGQYGKGRTEIGWVDTSYYSDYDGVREVLLEDL